MPSIETLTLPLVLTVASAVSLGLVYGLRVLATYLKGKTHNQFVGYVLTVVETLAEKVVSETYQAYVSPLKESGSFDKASQKVALDKALAALKAYLGTEGLAKVTSILGSGSSTDDFLKTFLEDAVLNSKPTIATAQAVAPPQQLPGVVLAPSSNPN